MAQKTQIEAPKSKKKSPTPHKKRDSRKAWKKFNRRVSLLIFLAAAGTAFYLGFIQLKIPEGYGVILHSKIQLDKDKDGYDDKIYRSGGFLWRWQGIIPTNLTIHKVPLTFHQAHVVSEGELPSGDIYLDHAGISGDFSYRIEVFVQYRLKEDYMLQQIRQGLMDAEEIGNYYEQSDQEIISYILNRISTLDITEESNKGTELPLDWDSLDQDLIKEYPHLEFKQTRLISQKIPDILLYQQLRSQFISYLEEKNKAFTEVSVATQERELLTEERMQIMERYGELITQYPLLLDFFAMDKGANWEELDPSMLLTP